MSEHAIQDEFVVGGIYNMQMYNYPTSSKIVAKWNMRKICSVDERLVNIPYCEPTSNTGEVDMKLILPKTLYMGEDPSTVKIAIWDESRSSWSTDLIGGEKDKLEYSPTDSQIRFKTRTFAPLALL